MEVEVLNLVINGLPSILNMTKQEIKEIREVLNLVINGLPSIPQRLIDLGAAEFVKF